MLANSWRTILADDPTNARPIVSSLLKGRVTILPTTKHRWTMSGEGALTGLFQSAIFQSGPRPQRDSNPCFGLERSAQGLRQIAGFRPIANKVSKLRPVHPSPHITPNHRFHTVSGHKNGHSAGGVFCANPV
jgi:hypothetical protein